MKRTLSVLTAIAALCAVTAAGPAFAQQTGGESRMFQRFDVNKDGQVTRAEAKSRVAERFARMDTNRDGVVTPDERLAARQGRTNRRAERFARIDANGDGVVSLDEMRVHAPQRAERRFARLDTNRDGVLSLGEVVAPRGNRGAGNGPMTLQDLDVRVMRMFDRADRNRDGVITRDEANLMRRQ